jgi:hypothetical protein
MIQLKSSIILRWLFVCSLAQLKQQKEIFLLNDQMINRFFGKEKNILPSFSSSSSSKKSLKSN